MSTAKKKPEAEEVVAAKPDAPVEANERRDPPADQDQDIDSASGALITGEDADGNPLTTNDVAAGAEPVTPGRSKDDKHDEDEKPKKKAGPVVDTLVSWNGLTATDTVDGVEQASRPATLAEQLTQHADELLRLVVGTVPYATSGSIDVDGESITITLVSH